MLYEVITDLGPDGRIGVEYLYSDRTNIYLNYEIEDERTDNGLRARKGNLISGFRTRYSDSTSVYLEDKYQHGDVPTGLMHSTGINYAPTDRWSLGAKADFGTLTDNLTGAEIKRSAFGVHLSYGFKALKFATAVEYGKDETEGLDRITSYNVCYTKLLRTRSASARPAQALAPPCWVWPIRPSPTGSK